ncbi:MAG: hypothetical protein SGPRY_006984 [Prymnesium sp.]
MYELRVIVWEATEVALKDEGVFGSAGKSDVWDFDLIGANDAIGEAQLNLKPLCLKASKRGGSVRQDSFWVPCTHPNFKQVQARVRMTIELVSRADAIMKPAGKGRGPPNQYPYLPEPIRPNMFQGLGSLLNLNLFNPFFLLKKYRLCCCGCCICLIISIVIFLQVQGG